MDTPTLSCIACGKSLDSVLRDDDVENQPYGGTCFTTHGHYGSTIFDPMDGHYLELNVCDVCLRRLAGEGKILLGRDSKPVVSEIGEIPTRIGSAPVIFQSVTWDPGLEYEREDEHDELVLEPGEIGSDAYPEVRYHPGILDAYGPGGSET